jgi:copper chaperone CopZ
MKENTRTINFQIGITCGGCALDMENILLDEDGIIKAAAHYAKGTLSVEYDPDQIEEEEVLELVNKFGLPVTRTSSPS